MPKLPPRACTFPGCASYAITSGRCNSHAIIKQAWESSRVRTRHERGYGSAWEKTRKVILERDRFLCCVCNAKGFTTMASQVDHITPKSAGGSDSYDNLQAICDPCHKQKTKNDKIKYAR